MVEAVAKDGEMSVHVRRGAGKSYSDEGVSPSWRWWGWYFGPAFLTVPQKF